MQITLKHKIISSITKLQKKIIKGENILFTKEDIEKIKKTSNMTDSWDSFNPDLYIKFVTLVNERNNEAV